MYTGPGTCGCRAPWLVSGRGPLGLDRIHPLQFTPYYEQTYRERLDLMPASWGASRIGGLARCEQVRTAPEGS
jgi:hypothetical protein